MAATGIIECEEILPDKQRRKDIGLRLVEMALEMNRLAKGFFYQGGDDGNDLTPFDLKIGIHKGEFIAGVIGYHKP